MDLLRSVPQPPVGAVRFPGVDDFALRKGASYANACSSPMTVRHREIPVRAEIRDRPHRRVDDHEAVNTDYWAVLADSDREQWGFVPRRTVGPLDFGVDRHEAVTIMAGHGFVAEECEIERWNPQRAQWRVEFRRAESDEHQPAVKCYFIEGVGLTCVFVDGLHGPQVTCEGIRLIGRVAWELDAELEAGAVERGLSWWYCPTGYVCWADFSFERGAQVAGDTLLSWASFGNPGELANSSWDMAPAEVRHHGWSAWN
ncbi:hypothetical protein OG780_43250 [Streptomyces sp. NBC_00386]|uniref:hypothetical protein n=1 Tax=Streptomyces sp. NBC_00386 TaxID=2975734 RepID=UPI002E223A58